MYHGKPHILARNAFAPTSTTRFGIEAHAISFQAIALAASASSCMGDNQKRSPLANVATVATSGASGSCGGATASGRMFRRRETCGSFHGERQNHLGLKCGGASKQQGRNHRITLRRVIFIVFTLGAFAFICHTIFLSRKTITIHF
jgi:hypothetical protein